ncbi:hypothetical protein BT69DRAFT_866079 [Atractiella rhizophila]|nr:hypothetical protein BT69DRAFT_866079 [Atractiella rhizophila]
MQGTLFDSTDFSNTLPVSKPSIHFRQQRRLQLRRSQLLLANTTHDNVEVSDDPHGTGEPIYVSLAGNQSGDIRRVPQTCSIGMLPTEVLLQIFRLCMPSIKEHQEFPSQFVDQITKLRSTCVVWARAALDILRTQFEGWQSGIREPYIWNMSRTHHFYISSRVVGRPHPTSRESWGALLESILPPGPPQPRSLSMINLPWPSLRLNACVDLLSQKVGINAPYIDLTLEFSPGKHRDSISLAHIFSAVAGFVSLKIVGLDSLQDDRPNLSNVSRTNLSFLHLTRCNLSRMDLGSIGPMNFLRVLEFSSFSPLLTPAEFASFLWRFRNGILTALTMNFENIPIVPWEEYLMSTFPVDLEYPFSSTTHFPALTTVSLDGGHDNSCFISLKTLLIFAQRESLSRLYLYYCSCATPDAVSQYIAVIMEKRDWQISKQYIEIRPFFADWEFEPFPRISLHHSVRSSQVTTNGVMYFIHGRAFELCIVDGREEKNEA